MFDDKTGAKYQKKHIIPFMDRSLIFIQFVILRTKQNVTYGVQLVKI